MLELSGLLIGKFLARVLGLLPGLDVMPMPSLGLFTGAFGLPWLIMLPILALGPRVVTGLVLGLYRSPVPLIALFNALGGVAGPVLGI